MAKVDLMLKRDKRKGQLFDQGMIVPTAIGVGDAIAEWFPEQSPCRRPALDAVMKGSWKDTGSSDVSAPELVVEGAKAEGFGDMIGGEARSVY